MERVHIANAIRTLEFVVQVLDNAYWEASEVAHKDAIHNMISVLHGELNELAKLSVEDHSMAYEPITTAFRGAKGKLQLLQTNLHLWVRRSSTAYQLETELPTLSNLLSPKT